MFKLYVLGIIFYVCATILAEPHARELVKQANIKKKTKRGKMKSWINTIIMGLMPVVNVIAGILLLVIISGAVDELIIQELKKNSSK